MDNIVTTVGDTGSVSGRGNVTVTDTGLKAPTNIIMRVEAARTYYENYRQNHVKRVMKYTAIEGLIGGNAPYDSAELKSAGLSHVTNVNTLDAKGKFDKAGLTFWNLINQTENFVKFEVRNLGTQQDKQYGRWAQILASNWTKVIKEDWTDFVSNMNIATGQLVKFGYSPIVWSDEKDFKWETVDVSKFYVADQTPVTVDKWSCVCFETTYTMQYMWGVYQTIKDAEGDALGWNKSALENFILYRANTVNKASGSTSRPFNDMLDFQHKINNGDVNAGSVFTDSFTLVHMMYKEYSGKISHFIFDPIPNSTTDFLYKLPEQYEKFEDGVVVITYSPEERTIHGNRGVGHKIFPICQAMTQLDCTLFDMSKMSSTVIVKSMSNTTQAAAPIRFIPGVATDIGQSDIVQNTLGANVDRVVTVANYFERKIDKNAIISGDDPSVPDADRGSKSTTEVQMQSLKEFGIGKNSVSHFYNFMDRIYRNMVIKMLLATPSDPGYDVAERWKNLCLEDGVPEEVFEIKREHKMPNHLTVTAARAAGDGSTAGLIVALNRVGPVAGAFGQEGQQNYRRDVVRANLGEDYAARYLSDSMTPDEAAGGSSLAVLENIVMKNGEPPMVSRDNQHKSHIGVHMNLIMETIKGVQAQEIEPQAADQILAVSIDHLQQHVKIIAEDSLNEAYVMQLAGTMKQINKFAQLNRARAQKMMQAEVRRRGEEEQQMNADMMEQDRKDKVMEREEARKDFKVKAQVARAEEASTTRAEIMRRDVERKADNQRLDVELKNEVKQAEIRKPQEILANQSTQQLQDTLKAQVGETANPVDFK